MIGFVRSTTNYLGVMRAKDMKAATLNDGAFRQCSMKCSTIQHDRPCINASPDKTIRGCIVPTARRKAIETRYVAMLSDCNPAPRSVTHFVHYISIVCRRSRRSSRSLPLAYTTRPRAPLYLDKNPSKYSSVQFSTCPSALSDDLRPAVSQLSSRHHFWSCTPFIYTRFARWWRPLENEWV